MRRPVAWYELQRLMVGEWEEWGRYATRAPAVATAKRQSRYFGGITRVRVVRVTETRRVSWRWTNA